MATFKRFEEIEAWQMARELTKSLYDISGQGRFSRDYGLRDQLRRASVSIMSNIAEGFERSGDKEFLQFLSVAKGSCGEVQAQLYVAADQRYIDNAEFELLRGHAVRVSKTLLGLMKYLRDSPLRGSKFRAAQQEP